MSTSETITRTDLTNILNEVLPCDPDSVFKVQEFTSSGGATYSAFSSGNIGVPITSPTGYLPFAVLGTRTNGNIMVNYPDDYRLNSSSTSVIVWLRNPTNSSMTITSVSVGVLFVKA